MANIGIVSDYSTNILRRFFEPKLLITAKDNLQLSALSLKRDLPRGAGSDNTVRFFRRKATARGTDGVLVDSTTAQTRVSSLTEATALATYTDAADYSVVNATLVQFGAKAKIGDLTSAQMLLPLLKDTITLFGEELARYVDNQLAQKLVTGQLTANKIYSGGATSSATLDALSQSAGALSMPDLLRAVTLIKANRGRLFNGKAVAVVPVQCGLDIQQDADWIDAKDYADPSARINGELGSYGAVRMVETTDPFIEDMSDNAEATYDSSDSASGTGYITPVLGMEAIGDVELSGQSPFSPRIYVLDKEDKSDALNQFTVVGWKAHWVGVVLNNAWYSIIRSKATM